MTQIPDHLLARSKARREQLEVKIPQLLDRATAARQKAVDAFPGPRQPELEAECARCINDVHTFLPPCTEVYVEPPIVYDTISTPREASMLDNVEQLREENTRLRQALRDAGVPVGLVNAIAEGRSYP